MILFNRKYGEGRPVLVILHGLFGQSDNWTSIARKLSENFTVYCFDLRNHGQSAHDEVNNLGSMADDVMETLRNLGETSVHLLGHSMGGKVAMEFALKFADLLKSLILVDIGPRPYPPHHQEIIAGLNAVKPESLQNRSEAETRLSEYVYDTATRQFLLKNLYRRDDNSFAWRFNLKVIEREIEEIGKPMSPGVVENVPTLIYHGGASRYVKQEEYADIRARFPMAEFIVMEGAGHWLHAEKPTEFIEIIQTWLQKHS